MRELIPGAFHLPLGDGNGSTWPGESPQVIFSNESPLRIRWPKYWSFSFNISPSNEHPGLISFRMDWLDLLAVQGPKRRGSLRCLPPLEVRPSSVAQKIAAFELWCWRRLLRVTWTARTSNQSILKEISPGCSLEGLMLKLKLQYFGHLM